MGVEIEIEYMVDRDRIYGADRDRIDRMIEVEIEIE